MLASEIETRISMTDDSEWDAPGGIVGSLLLYRPEIENNSATVSIVTDSNDSSRQMARAACTAGQGFQTNYFFEYPGAGVGSDGVFDNQPDECWLSFEFEFNTTITAGSGNWLQILRLTDENGDEILLRQRGGTNFFQWLNVGSGSILSATHRHTTDLSPNVRYELRIHWDSDNDTITVTVVNLDSGSLLIDEESVGNITSFGKLAKITLGCLTNGIGQNYDFRKVIINPVSAPAAMDSTSTWWPEDDHKPPYSAAQKTDNGSEDVDVNLVYVFNPGIMGSGDTWKFQYREGTSGSWTDIAAVTANSAGFMQDVLEDLDPATTYQARLSNSGGTVTTRPCTFVTQSASDDDPTVLKYTFNSCISQRAHPHRCLYHAAQEGTHTHHVIEDMGYHNTIGSWNEGSDWVALGTKSERQTAWIKMTKMQLLNTYWEYIGSEKGLTIGLGDHLFRNDLAGGLAKYTAGGDDETMLDDIKEVVELTIVPFRFFDGTSADGDYWTTWETARTAQVWYNTRMAADCDEGRSPALYGGQASTWDGQVDGAGGLVPGDTGDWGTTLLGSTQLSDVRTFVQGTDKPILVMWCPSLPFSGGMREYQDMATYAEFCQILADARDNEDIFGVYLLVGDLHNEMAVLGKNILSPAALDRLGYTSDVLSKVRIGVLAGGGLRDPHNLRAQIGNTTDDDGGLRGGDWDGESDPRWDHARDTNDAYLGPAASWDLDDSNANYDDDGYKDHGGAFSCFGEIEIDEVNLTVSVKTYDGQDGDETYSNSFSTYTRAILRFAGGIVTSDGGTLYEQGDILAEYSVLEGEDVDFEAIAAHKDGIESIVFSLSDGTTTVTKTVTDWSLSTYTNSQAPYGPSGVYKASFTGAEIATLDDGEVTLEITATPSDDGWGRTMTHTFLNNAGDTRSVVTIYADSVNGDDGTGDGSSGNPYASLQVALEQAATAASGSISDPEDVIPLVYLEEGTYALEQVGSPYAANLTWATVAAAPGAAKANIDVHNYTSTSGIGHRVRLLRFKGITIDRASAAGASGVIGHILAVGHASLYTVANGLPDTMWFDDCTITHHLGRDGQGAVSAQVLINDTNFAAIPWFTRCYIADMYNDGISLEAYVRDCKFQTLTGDVINDMVLAMDIWAEDTKILEDRIAVNTVANATETTGYVRGDTSGAYARIINKYESGGNSDSLRIDTNDAVFADFDDDENVSNGLTYYNNLTDAQNETNPAGSATHNPVHPDTFQLDQDNLDRNAVVYNCAGGDLDGQQIFMEKSQANILVANCAFWSNSLAFISQIGNATAGEYFAEHILHWNDFLANQAFYARPEAVVTYRDCEYVHCIALDFYGDIPSTDGTSNGITIFECHATDPAATYTSSRGAIDFENIPDYDETSITGDTDFSPSAGTDTAAGVPYISSGQARIPYDADGNLRSDDGSDLIGAFAFVGGGGNDAIGVGPGARIFFLLSQR